MPVALLLRGASTGGGMTLEEHNLVESHFEANQTLVEPDFGRKEFGRISFWSKQQLKSVVPKFTLPKFEF
jgi:hypothetical protein